MPAPTSAVDICNLALDCFGERGNVASIEEPEQANEIIMARHYDVTRRALLREHIWNFARSEKTIARTGDGGLYYNDEYLLPSDNIRLLAIAYPDYECRIGGYDYTDGTLRVNRTYRDSVFVTPTPGSIDIRYVRDVTDVSKFDPLFVKYFALQLAIDVAYKFSQERTQLETLLGVMKGELPKVVSVNSQERKPVRVEYSKWRRAHMSSYAGGVETSADQRYWVVVE